MMKKLIAIILLLAITTGLYAQLFKKGILIHSAPKSFQMAGGNSVFNSLKINSVSSAQWFVFSDRENNLTYVNPDGQTVFKRLSFMDIFYVIGRTNGYLKIVKYNPSIVSGSRIRDPKSAENFGWVEESNMLMWTKAFVSPDDNEPMKSISMVNNKEVLQKQQQHFIYDSVKVFESPFVQAPETGKLKMDDLVYVYKITDDGSFVLVGKKEQITPDTSAKNDMLGWVSAQLIQPWGKRLYLMAVTEENMSINDIESKVNAAFITSNNSGSIQNVEGTRGTFKSDDKNLDTIQEVNNSVEVDSFDNVSGSSGIIWRYRPVSGNYPGLLKSFPVYSHAIKDNDTKILKVGVPVNLFDLPRSSVSNLKGSLLTYQDYLELHNNIKKINFVFVADGGSPMKKYFPILINFLQGIQNNLSTNNQLANNISYGAVVYRNMDNCSSAKNSIASAGLSIDVNNVVDFLYNEVAETNTCSEGIESQPLFQGVQKALQLFPETKFQNNIIILVGATGNSYSEGSLSKSELINSLSEKNTKIFAFQPYSQYSILFNNFVLELKDLLEMSAINLTEQQKFWTVTTEDLVLTPKFNSGFEDTTAYYLDFPVNSMVPGGILFPTKGSVGSYKEFEGYIRKTIEQIYNYNSKLLSSLDIAFNKAGIRKENLNPALTNVFSRTGIDSDANNWIGRLPYNGYRYFMEKSISTDAIDTGGILKYCLILSDDELRSLQNNLSKLSIYDNASLRNTLRKRFHDNFSHIVETSSKYANKNISQITLSESFESIVGLPIQNDLLAKYNIADILKASEMNDGDFEQLLKYFEMINNNLKSKISLGDKFLSIGEPYYIINGVVFK